MSTDSELLRQHVENGSQAAFTELVRRYAALVYLAALRSVGGKAYLAEDVTQDVFILLARKAPMLIGHKTLVGWLYSTTRYVALSTIRNLRRREIREEKAATMQINSAPDVEWEQLRPLLDEAMERLDNRDRTAVLLRYFQGQSHREVGAALGLSENTAQARVDRAVEKLRRHFARNGVVTTAALLGEVLSANSAQAQAVPAGLIDKVAAVAHAKGLSLGHTILKAIYMTTKTKIAITTAVMVAIIAAIPLQIESRANTRLQDELDVTQKEANTLKAGQHKLETQLADQSLELQVLRAEQKSSLAAGTGSGSATNPVLNPRAPMPAVYPNRPKLADLMASAQASGDVATRNAAMSEAMLRVQYGNLIQKMRFTPEQADAFVKILSSQEDQKKNAILQYQLTPQTLSNMRTMTNEQAQAVVDQHDQQLADLNQTIEQNATAQLQPLLGSADNVDYYNTYTDQNKERTIIAIGYAQMLDTAGVPPLTLDQEEQVVNLVYQYRTALNGSGIGGLPIPPDQATQLLQQAGAFLTPDQVGVLQQVLPSLVAPLHKSTSAGG
jgi:RNA polymerase sigma factor (sigma-70 family)